MIVRHLVALALVLSLVGSLAAQTKKEKSADQSNSVRFINPPGLVPSPAYTHVAEITRGRLILVSGQLHSTRTATLSAKATCGPKPRKHSRISKSLSMRSA